LLKTQLSPGLSHETPQVHHSSRRSGGRVANRGARRTVVSGLAHLFGAFRLRLQELGYVEG
jgi:hypothetical protein